MVTRQEEKGEKTAQRNQDEKEEEEAAAEAGGGDSIRWPQRPGGGAEVTTLPAQFYEKKGLYF